MKKQLLLSAAALCGSLAMFALGTGDVEIKDWINKNNVILPSSQLTPAERYTAQTWVITGDNYYELRNQNGNEDHYNRILGVPADDAEGRKWYDPGYELTVDPENNIEWKEEMSPFSNDEYYKDQPSYRWTQTDIMGEIYFRRSFTLNEPLPAQDLLLSAGHDDAPAEWYLNGVLVCSVGDGWNNDWVVILSEEHKALVKTDGSENILAVHVHQNWGGAFADCGLYYADMTKAEIIVPSVRDKKEPWASEYFFPIDDEDLNDLTAEGWYKPDFDLEQWPGCAWEEGFGPYANDMKNFGTDEDRDDRPWWNNCEATYWNGQESPIMVRRFFDLSADDLATIKEEVSNGKQLNFICSYDENPLVYLNGEFICEWAEWNDNNYATHTFTEEQLDLLVEGKNMFAVSLTGGNGGSHIDFGMELYTSNYIPSGIENVMVNPVATEMNDNRIFDLQGRFVGTDMEKLGRGIYIKGGKKVLVNK